MAVSPSDFRYKYLRHEIRIGIYKCGKEIITGGL